MDARFMAQPGAHSTRSGNGCCHCIPVLPMEKRPFQEGSGPFQGREAGRGSRGGCQLIPPLPGRPKQPERSGRICKDKHRPLVTLATGHAPPAWPPGQPLLCLPPSPLLSALDCPGLLGSFLGERTLGQWFPSLSVQRTPPCHADS